MGEPHDQANSESNLLGAPPRSEMMEVARIGKEPETPEEHQQAAMFREMIARITAENGDPSREAGVVAALERLEGSSMPR